MPSKSAGSRQIIDRILSLEIVRVTERAAVAANWRRWRSTASS
jgi:3-methyladenine DNA glycosylase/8-oxoguanine DNA glycosylase